MSERPAPSALAFLRDRYLTIDPRILGLFRIYFGLFLCIDVLRRLPDAGLFYSNDGVLSNHFNLFAPLGSPTFSLLHAFSTRTEVQVSLVAMALGHFLLAVGYRTKLFQILALVSVVSLNVRNLFLENGGCIMTANLAAWTMFLPLGSRYSVDALLARLRGRTDRTADALNERATIAPFSSPVVSVAVLAITLEIAACYFFNTVHKTGSTWKSGQAVHWLLWQNRIATVWAAWLRMHEPGWLSPMLSYGTLIVEGAAPLLVLSPFFQTRLRTLHVALIYALHISIALLVSVGPFSYVMLALNFLVLPPAVLDRAEAWLRARSGGVREIVYRASDPWLHAIARVLSRLDGFERLRFVDAGDESHHEGAPNEPFVLRTPEGTWLSGPLAFAEAVRALPLGAAWAYVPRVVPLRVLWDAAMRARTSLATQLGLVGASPTAAGAPAFELVPSHRGLTRRFAVAGEVIATALFAALIIQISHDNWWIPERYRMTQPRALAPLVMYPRLFQGWSMFAPDAPLTDGTLVVDGVTEDGRHLDPFTGEAPDFEAAFHGPWYMGQLRCDYWLKIHFDGNAGYRDELRRYLERWHQIENRPKDRLTSFTVYWVENDAPPPGSTVPTNVRKTAIVASVGAGAGRAAWSAVDAPGAR